jgi:DNA primase
MCGAPSKFYLNTVKHVAICFKGCFTGSTVSLVASFEGCDLSEAGEKIHEGENWYHSVIRNLTPEASQRFKDRRTIFMLPKLRPLNQTEGEYLTGRNVSVSFAERHEASGCDDFMGLVAAFCDCTEEDATKLVQAFPTRFSYLEHRIIFPIYDEGILIGAEARATDGSQPKVCYPQGVNLKDTLFYSMDPEPIEWITLVEGILDALTLEAWGIPCAASFASGISKMQSALLHRFARVYVSYDADRGGDKGVKDVVEHLYQGTTLYEVKLPGGKDPNDCDFYTYSVAFSKAQRITDAHPAVAQMKPKRRSSFKRKWDVVRPPSRP